MRPFFKRFLIVAIAILVLVFLALLATAFWPSQRATLVLQNQPVASYENARARVAMLLASPPAEVRAECRSAVLDHGRRTRDVYVLLHGLTNCPLQFRKFADQLYANGANVLLLRLPYHGLTDRMNTEQSRLTAQDLLDSANEAVDLARGYGERVIVVGLSISAVSAAWLAQERGDIALAVVIAPFLSPNGIPDSAIAPLDKLLLRLPNGFVWWDSRQKENLIGSPAAYPRFATRSIGQVMDLGLDLFSRAGKAPPRTPRILLVTSPADTAISMPRVNALEAMWKGHARHFSFPAEWNVPHDAIDPAQPGEQTARVYPQLIEWINAELK